jgi:aminoglycoside phosphotransferase family enzyme/predicted kinase
MTAPDDHPDPLHRTADQDAVFDLLADPATHGIDGPVARIDTHGAAVFLAGGDAYKVKRAVRFPFMDYGTLEKRHEACLAEVAVNAPDAPGLYLGVTASPRDGTRLALRGQGEPVEYAVHMRRFDETATLDRIAARDGLDDATIEAVVDAVLASHARAPVRPGGPATDDLARYLDQNREAFAETADIFPADAAERLVDRARVEWTRLRPLLLERGNAGLVRRCHGDLHLRNIVLVDGRPVLFDAIEFSDAIATGDVLYDLAFLVMDLVERAFAPAANLVLQRYLDRSDPAMRDGLAAMPLFVSIRASIRAKVIAAGIGALPEAARAAARREALRYFDLAIDALAPSRPLLVAIGGRSGTGKSTLARALAPHVGRLPGAVRLSSDQLRKRLAGVPETEALAAASYTRAASERVYDALRAEARALLATGSSVIVDAVHLAAGERDAIAAVARAADARFVGLWLEAPLPDLVTRIEDRPKGASDATPEVARLQAGIDTGPMDWTVIDAASGRDAVLTAALAALGADR